MARNSPVGGAMLCILHGWLLEGSGSNLWTRAVVRSLCRKGETVHLVCQENHPERYDFISESITHYLNGRSERTYSRERALTGECILHKPELGGVLPVFVWDEYEEHSNVVPMIDLSTEEIEKYVAINVNVVRSIVRSAGIDVIHANHAVMMPVVGRRIREEQGIPYSVMPHGSDIEYAVKKDDRFLAYASEALTSAGKIFVIGDEMRSRVLKVFPDIEAIGSKLVELHLGVDTSDFELVPRAERQREMDHLREALRDLPRGKTAAQEAALSQGLRAVGDFASLSELLRSTSDYDGKKPDETAEQKLATIDWREAPTLLFVGRLIAWKGIQSLVAALPRALAVAPHLRTIIVGHGPLREAMEAMVWAFREGRRDIIEMIIDRGRALDGSTDADTGIEELDDVRGFFDELESRGALDAYFTAARENITASSVVFTGYLTHNELRHLFPCCDVGVFPSVVREAGPLVFLEALASGCFPLGTYFGGMKASIDAVGAELPADVSDVMKLDPKNTVRDLTTKIPEALVQSRRYRDTLSRVARENYDWSSVAKTFVKEVDSLARPRAAATS